MTDTPEPQNRRPGDDEPASNEHPAANDFGRTGGSEQTQPPHAGEPGEAGSASSGLGHPGDSEQPAPPLPGESGQPTDPHAGEPGWSGQSAPANLGQPGESGQPTGYPGAPSASEQPPHPGQPGWSGQAAPPYPGQPGWSGQPTPPHPGQAPPYSGQAPPYSGQPGWSGQPAPPYPPAWGGQPGWHGQPPPRQWQQPPAVKPGVIPLRPLDLGEILDGAISTMRAHPRLVLGVAAIVVVITQLVTLVATYPLLDDLNRVAQFDQNTPADEIWGVLGTSLAVSGIALVFTVVSRVFLSGFLTVVVGSAVLGQKLSFGEAWARVRPRLLPLLGLTLIYPAVTVGAVLVLVLLTAAVPPIGILAILGAVVVGIWLWVMFSLATPALVLENAGVGRAFGRSRHLVHGAWWRIFGITLLAAVIAVVLALIISLPFEALGGGISLSGTTAMTTQYLLLSSIGTIIASTLTEPFIAAVTVLLYTDQRMRKEGLDIELARAAGTPR